MVTFTWPRKRFLFTGIIAVVVGFIALAITQFGAGHFQLRMDGVSTALRGGTVHLDVADTPQARTQGLSGVTKLRSDEGLLFDFETDGKWGIWMKDMKIPIDILWLDKKGRVVYIVRDAQPELSTKKTFTPNEPARYVIELNAGAAERYMVRVGDIVEFER